MGEGEGASGLLHGLWEGPEQCGTAAAEAPDAGGSGGRSVVVVVVVVVEGLVWEWDRGG